MFNDRNSAFSSWPYISNLSMSTWPAPSTNLSSQTNPSWKYETEETSSPRLSSSSEPSPTDAMNSFPFEEVPANVFPGSWNMSSLDQLAAKLLTISEENIPVDPIIPTSTPRLSPVTVQEELNIQIPSSNPRSSPNLSFDKDERSGDSSDTDGPCGPNSRFKTEICRNYKEKGQCLYGEQCQFAHGNEEMRNVGQHSRYKTKRCQKYWIAGYCAYGPRCNFLHNEERDQVQPKHGHVQTVQAQNLQNQRRMASIRKGSAGELSGESNNTTPSVSPSNIKFKLPTTPIPLEVLDRPTYGSGRLAAYTTKDGNFFWIDLRTQKFV